MRAMVVGIPNVGKSTFINTYAGKACTKTGNKPGVTKGKQWIRLNKNVELLDTPGILWPKFEDQTVGMKLAIIGSIKDDLLDITELAWNLTGFLVDNYPGILEKRYNIDEKRDKIEIIEQIALARGCLQKGGAPDTAKASKLLLDDFRSARLGAITLDPSGVKGRSEALTLAAFAKRTRRRVRLAHCPKITVQPAIPDG